jgi:hypothetical protein
MRKIKIFSIVGGIISILVLYGIFFKVYDYFTCTFATQAALAQMDKKVDEDKKDLAIYKLKVYLRELQQQIWLLQDRLEKKPSDTIAKQTLRKYLADQAETQKQIEEIQKK